MIEKGKVKKFIFSETPPFYSTTLLKHEHVHRIISKTLPSLNGCFRSLVYNDLLLQILRSEAAIRNLGKILKN